MVEAMINRILHGDASALLRKIEDCAVDLVLTDPPYFLDKLDNHWEHEKVADPRNQRAVKSLPAGMKFDRRQGAEFYKWYVRICADLYRVLKPGGFFFSFSSPRLYHRMACAVEDAGFAIRDCFIWLYTQNQPKAMSLNHFIRRLPIDEGRKAALVEALEGWKTPQVRSCFEPIVMAQKPCQGTFLDNIREHATGLINTQVRTGTGQFPANVLTTEYMLPVLDRHFLVRKPTKREKGNFNVHRTVKPLAICEFLISLCTFSRNAIVLDPFVGSGTTAVAAKRLGRRYVGFDINSEYVEIARRRLQRTRRVHTDSSGQLTLDASVA